jgi:hypothetical protein
MARYPVGGGTEGDFAVSLTDVKVTYWQTSGEGIQNVSR